MRHETHWKKIHQQTDKKVVKQSHYEVGGVRFNEKQYKALSSASTGGMLVGFIIGIILGALIW